MQFKNIATIFLAAALGALFMKGLTSIETRESIENIKTDNPLSAHQVSYNTSPTFSTLPMDFVTASEKGTAAVVHIVASESKTLAQQRMQESRRGRSNDPFGQFFNLDDFFGGGSFFERGFNQPKNGSGSGVILTEDGYIVTNNHVVGFADQIKVTLNDGREMKAEKVGTDPSTDIAVLKIEGSNLPTINYANSDQVKIGEWVLAVGNPFNLTSTVTAGIVSAKGRDLDIIKESKSIEEFIQTDAVVNPGNSGGALLDTRGGLIGINTAISTPTGVYAGYSFAIPSNLVKRIVDDIIENGNIERTNLGIGGYTIDDEVKNELNLNVDSGVYIDYVDRGSAAQFSGLLPGDIITEVNNREILSFEDIVDEMKFTKVGDVLDVSILRNGKLKTFHIKLRKKI